MEFLEGKSLSAVLCDAQRPDARAAPRATSPSRSRRASAAAHAANIVHRDLKPDNVMLINRGAEKDFVKILDFGIAKVGGGTKKMTRAGSVFGTPHYMSPEQAAGATVDHRTDIYALGVILYEMASGKVPFDADNFMGILTQHMYKAPVPIRALVARGRRAAGARRDRPEVPHEEARGALRDDGRARGRPREARAGARCPDAVQEMMARSGGFNVPADYFRSSAMPAPVPGLRSPGLGRGGPLYAGIGGSVAAVAVVLAIFAKSATTHANPVSPPPASLVMNAAPAPPVASATPSVNAGSGSAVNPAPAASAASATVETREVFLVVEPSDAKVTREGKDLGALPTSLHVKPGESVPLVVARAGYKTQTVTLDGSQPRMLVKLERAGGKPAKAPAARPAEGTPAVGDFQDPFLKK